MLPYIILTTGLVSALGLLISAIVWTIKMGIAVISNRETPIAPPILFEPYQFLLSANEDKLHKVKLKRATS